MAVQQFNPPEAPSYQSGDSPTFQVDPFETNIGVGHVRALSQYNLRRGSLTWSVMDQDTREYILDFIDGLAGLPGPFTWQSFDLLPTPVTREPTVEQVAGGALGAETAYFVFTWYDSSGETKISKRVSFTKSANNFYKVTMPRVPTGADGWKLYASTTSGSEVLQATVNDSRTWTQSAALATGTASPPASNTLFPLRRFFFGPEVTVPRVSSDYWDMSLEVLEQLM